MSKKKRLFALAPEILALRSDNKAKKNMGKEIVSQSEGGHDEYDLKLFDIVGWPWITARNVSEKIPKDAKKINVYINSPGGEVFEGMAIYSFLKNHSAEVNVYIYGLAASIATIIALAGSKTYIDDTAFFMIHDPWCYTEGNADSLIKEVELLRSLENTISDVYSGKTGKTKEEILDLMHQETWFNAEEAIEAGFVDDLYKNKEDFPKDFYNLKSFKNKPDRKKVLNKKKEDAKLNPTIRKMLEEYGLKPDATEDEAKNFLSKLLEQSKKGNKGDDGVKTLREADLLTIKLQAIEEEKERQKAIRRFVNSAGLENSFADELIEQNLTVNEASSKIFEKMEKENPVHGSHRIETGESEQEKFKAAAIDGLLLRAGKKVEKPAPGSENLQGYEMSAIIREALRRANVDVSNLNSRRMIADYVFSRPMGSMTTSDFPEIFRDVASKSLQQAYKEYPATWEPFVNKTTANDFKEIYGVSLSEAPALELVNEAGEYTEGALKEGKNSYRIAKYGKILSLSWEMIVNDDLRAFTKLPTLLGNAARRKESDLVYDLLLSNPTMGDGKKLFAASRNNYVTSPTGEEITSETLQAAKLAMRKQKGKNGAYLDITTKYLVVALDLEFHAQLLLTAASSLETGKNAGVPNPFRNSMVLIADPRIPDGNWFCIADPVVIDTIEVAYLDGNNGPMVSENVAFKTDTLNWKVRHPFGCGAMEAISMYKNEKTG